MNARIVSLFHSKLSFYESIELSILSRILNVFINQIIVV